MKRLGEQLRAERERRGDTLQRVSEATRIREAYLEALERHDWDALPADVFTRGYLRSYAEHLGLDAEMLLRAHARERRIAGLEDPSTSEQGQHEAARAFLERLAQTQGVEVRRPASRLKWVALGGGGVAVVAVWLAFHLLGSSRGEPEAQETPAPVPRRAVETAPRPPAPPPVAPVPVAPAPALQDAAEEPRATHLKVGESGVGTGVVDHRLVGRADRFPEGTEVWFFTHVVGGGPGDTVQHVWLHGGRPVGVVELPVNGPHWRTQSHRSLPEGSRGAWTVEARDREGRVLATVAFACVAAD